MSKPASQLQTEIKKRQAFDSLPQEAWLNLVRTSSQLLIHFDRLFATSYPHGDPHGRVTFVRIDLDELHRRFGRG